MTPQPAGTAPARPEALLRRGRVLEAITLGWNVAGIIVLAIAAPLGRRDGWFLSGTRSAAGAIA